MGNENSKIGGSAPPSPPSSSSDMEGMSFRGDMSYLMTSTTQTTPDIKKEKRKCKLNISAGLPQKMPYDKNIAKSLDQLHQNKIEQHIFESKANNSMIPVDHLLVTNSTIKKAIDRKEIKKAIIGRSNTVKLSSINEDSSNVDLLKSKTPLTPSLIFNTNEDKNRSNVISQKGLINSASIKKKIFKFSKKFAISGSLNSNSSASFNSPEDEGTDEQMDSRLPKDNEEERAIMRDFHDVKNDITIYDPGLTRKMHSQSVEEKTTLPETSDISDKSSDHIKHVKKKETNPNSSDIYSHQETFPKINKSVSSEIIYEISVDNSTTISKIVSARELLEQKRRRSSASLDETRLEPQQFSQTDSTYLKKNEGKEEKLNQALEKRKFVLLELVETENEYVKDLGVIVNGYMACIKDQDPIPPESLIEKEKIIWGNIGQIYEWHRDVFCKEIGKCLENPDLLGWVFVKYERRFQMYVVYCQNKPKSEFIVSEFIDTYFEEVRIKLGQKLTLPDLLIKPVQRIMKYQLILKEYLKLTEKINGLISEKNSKMEDKEKHIKLDDTTLIKKAVDVMCIVPKTANDMMKLSRLQGWDGKVSAQGKLLLQDSLLVSSNPSNQPFKGKEWQVFVFEQIVLFSEPTSSQSSSTSSAKKNFSNLGYIYKNSIQTNKLSLKEHITKSVNGTPIDEQEDLRFILTGKSPEYGEVHFVCQASSKEAKTLWINQLKSMLSLQKDFLRALQSPIAYQKHLHTGGSTSDNLLDPSSATLIPPLPSSIKSSTLKPKEDNRNALKKTRDYIMKPKKALPPTTQTSQLNSNVITQMSQSEIIPDKVKNVQSTTSIASTKKANSLIPAPEKYGTTTGLLAALRKAVSQPSRHKLNEAQKKLDALRVPISSHSNDDEIIDENFDQFQNEKREETNFIVSNKYFEKDYANRLKFNPILAIGLYLNFHSLNMNKTLNGIETINENTNIIRIYKSELSNKLKVNIQFEMSIKSSNSFKNISSPDERMTQLSNILLRLYIRHYMIQILPNFNLKNSTTYIDSTYLKDGKRNVFLPFIQWFKISKNLNIPKTKIEKDCQINVFRRIWLNYNNNYNTNINYKDNNNYAPKIMCNDNLSIKFYKGADFSDIALCINFNKYKPIDSGSYFMYFDENFCWNQHEEFSNTLRRHKSKSLSSLREEMIQECSSFDFPLTKISQNILNKSFKSHNCLPFYLFILEPPYVLWKPTITESSEIGIRLNWRSPPNIINTFASLPFVIQIQHSNEISTKSSNKPSRKIIKPSLSRKLPNPFNYSPNILSHISENELKAGPWIDLCLGIKTQSAIIDKYMVLKDSPIFRLRVKPRTAIYPLINLSNAEIENEVCSEPTDVISFINQPNIPTFSGDDPKIWLSGFFENFIELKEYYKGETCRLLLLRNKMNGESNKKLAGHEGKLYLGKYIERCVRGYESVTCEYNILRRLQPHPNIVATFGAYSTPRRYIIILEKITGLNVIEHFKKAKVYSEAQIWDLIYFTFTALDYLHSQKIAHLDICPENIFIIPNVNASDSYAQSIIQYHALNGTIKLTGFSNSCHLPLPPSSSPQKPCVFLSALNTLYTAPEIFLKRILANNVNPEINDGLTLTDDEQHNMDNSILKKNNNINITYSNGYDFYSYPYIESPNVVISLSSDLSILSDAETLKMNNLEKYETLLNRIRDSELYVDQIHSGLMLTSGLDSSLSFALSNGEPSLKSDIWSLGIMMFFLLTGGTIPYLCNTDIVVPFQSSNQDNLQEYHEPDIDHVKLIHLISKILTFDAEDTLKQLFDAFQSYQSKVNLQNRYQLMSAQAKDFIVNHLLVFDVHKRSSVKKCFTHPVLLKGPPTKNANILPDQSWKPIYDGLSLK